VGGSIKLTLSSVPLQVLSAHDSLKTSKLLSPKERTRCRQGLGTAERFKAQTNKAGKGGVRGTEELTCG
jgi:hypothetical protein